MLKDMKIGKKLWILVAILLVCITGVSALSIFFMSYINQASTIISQNWLPSVIIVEELNTSTSDYRILELNHINAATAAEKTQYEDKMQSRQQEIEAAFSAYEPLVINDTDRSLMADAKQKWADYLSINQQVLQLSNQNQIQASFALANGEELSKFQEASDLFLQIVNFNKEGADAASARGDDLYLLSIIIFSIIYVAAVIIAIILSLYIIRLIVKPLAQINQAANKIAKGDLNIELNYTSNDELGHLVNAFHEMQSVLLAIIPDIGNILGAMADGNFDTNTCCEEQYVGEYQKIILSIRRLNRTLNNTIHDVEVASKQVASGADQVSSGAQALSQGATEQASAIQELSASISEIAEQVKLNAENAKTANGKAMNAGNSLSICTEQMTQMVSAMNNISTRSTEISKIIKVIDDIAFQTNILALNAAVEAARAGEAGKGFAVVADEVRNLAGKSANAAKDTTNLIDETIVAVKNGSDIVMLTSNTLHESAQETHKVVQLIEQIAKASDQQATSIAQVNIGVDQISSVVQTNSATSEESAAASEELSGQANMLQQLMSQFKLRQDRLSKDQDKLNQNDNFQKVAVKEYSILASQKY